MRLEGAPTTVVVDFEGIPVSITTHDERPADGAVFRLGGDLAAPHVDAYPHTYDVIGREVLAYLAVLRLRDCHDEHEPQCRCGQDGVTYYRSE